MAMAIRVLSVTRSIPRRQLGALLNKPLTLTTSTSKQLSSIPNPLLVKLLQEPNSGIKAALDLEERSSTLKSHTFAWKTLLPMLKSSSPTKAQLVLEWKLEQLLKENERDQSCYSELICLCGIVQAVSFALHVFTSMEGHGIRPTSAVFNSLITTCLSSGNLSTALSLFEIMEQSKDCKPNLDTYNAFISMFSRSVDGKYMEAWYLASKEVGFSPNVCTYESLIVGFIKAKQFDTAATLYEEMIISGVTPNIAVLEGMLECLCQQKKFIKVQQFLKFILDGEWKLSSRMIENLLQMYSELWRVGEMEELLLALTGTNHDSVVLAPVHCAIIRMYALSDRLDDLEFSVGRMLKQGILFTNPGDVEQVICSYFRRTAYDRLDLFLERIQATYKFTRSTYDLLVAGYRRVGLSKKMDLVIKDMTSAGYL